MKLSTKSIASLLTAVKKTVEQSRSVPKSSLKHLERLLRRHDRKGELRASVLNLDAATFKREHRRLSSEQMAKKYGFQDIIHYLQALYARLKHELRCRGWSARRLRQLEYLA